MRNVLADIIKGLKVTLAHSGVDCSEFHDESFKREVEKDRQMLEEEKVT